ncbi:MAG TPA: ComEC/Rec2 family competence protein [Candidatus Rifleibacterium sp.]|nr:ComEC/Rec2 family competence protein [Candidatus Rifleibacterium sp.]
MQIFIFLSLAFMAGMAFAVLSNATASGIFLLLTGVFGLCAAIPFWYKHSSNILEGNFAGIRNDDEALPALSLIFLILTVAAFGSFRYISELRHDYRGHLQAICEKSDESTRWRVRGRVTEEPKLGRDNLEVIIQPETIRKVERKRMQVGSVSEKGAKKKPGYENVDDESAAEIVTGGLILAQVFEEAEAFREVAFNQVVEIEGQLSEAAASRNPGSLDYRSHLRNRGIYRTIRILPRKATLRVIEEVEGGSLWYRFALHVKNEILKVIKQTMPYPESSFLGGVLLGLKGGLPAKVSQEFRMTGVSHVLAVSGLHVTIIAGLLYGIFAMFRVPLRVFAPIIVFSLFTFALIVGWPSSAVRAALMNSLFILARAYLQDIGFKLSVLFSLCVACDFILFMNPLQLTEPSFTLSVMAIYALAMFSEPSFQFLQRLLRGPGLMLAAVGTGLYYLVIIAVRSTVLYPWFFPLSGVYFLLLIYGAWRLSNLSSFQSFSFEMLPGWLKSFLAAQVAILVAMMGPLSAYYFGQFSLASPIANLIAIPLVGVIVQIGLVAGLIGAFVPLIGMPVALVLNAANWLGVKFFLGMATFFSLLIPFPRVSQPGFADLIGYFLLLHLVYFYADVKTWVIAIYSAVADLWEDEDYRNPLTGLGMLVVVVLGGVCILALSRAERTPDLRMTMLDVGFGASLLIESENCITLIDAGLNDPLAGTDRGERVVQPALSGKGAREIQAVFLTSALPERISGLHSVLDNYRVNKIYVPFPLPEDGRRVTFEDYARTFMFGDLKLEKRLKSGMNAGVPPSFFFELAFDSYNQLIEDVYRHKIPVVKIAAGDRITDAAGQIEVLYPAPATASETSFQQYYDGLILNISHNGCNYLYVSGNSHPLVEQVKVKPDFIFLADLPYPLDAFEKFSRAHNPAGIAVSFRFPSAWLMENYHLANTITARSRSYLQQFRQWPFPVYVTSETGAVQVDQNRSIINTRVFAKEQ